MKSKNFSDFENFKTSIKNKNETNFEECLVRSGKISEVNFVNWRQLLSFSSNIDKLEERCGTCEVEQR